MMHPSEPIQSAYLNPERLINGAIGRAQGALEAWRRGEPTDDVLHQLEKVHHAVENAQLAIVEHWAEAGASWDDIAAALGSTPSEVRRRFPARWPVGRGS